MARMRIVEAQGGFCIFIVMLFAGVCLLVLMTVLGAVCSALL